MVTRPLSTRKKSSVSSCLCQTKVPLTLTTIRSCPLNSPTVLGCQCSVNAASFSARLMAFMSREESERLLDQVGQGAEELRGAGAVQRAVIAREGEHHRGLDGRLPVDRDDAVGDAAYCEDRGLRRIDDGVEGVDAVHAEVADREPAALDIGQTELAGLAPSHDIFSARDDLRQ